MYDTYNEQCNACEPEPLVRLKENNQPETPEDTSDKTQFVEFGGLMLSQDWYERFIKAPYDALMELAPAAWTPAFAEAIVARPSFYNEGYSKKIGKWFHVRNTIDLIPDDCLTEKVILTFFGVIEDRIGSFAAAKNNRVVSQVTNGMAFQIFTKSLERDSFAPMGCQRFPRNLVTEDFVRTVLPLYSYQLLTILPKQMQDEMIYRMALGHNPACYGRLPTNMRTDKLGEESLQRAVKRDDITVQQYRAMLNAIPDLNNIDIKVLRDVVTRCPGMVKLITRRTNKFNEASLLSSALANDDMDEIRKAINATSTETLAYYLRLGFALKDTEEDKC